MKPSCGGLFSRAHAVAAVAAMAVLLVGPAGGAQPRNDSALSFQVEGDLRRIAEDFLRAVRARSEALTACLDESRSCGAAASDAPPVCNA